MTEQNPQEMDPQKLLLQAFTYLQENGRIAPEADLAELVRILTTEPEEGRFPQGVILSPGSLEEYRAVGVHNLAIGGAKMGELDPLGVIDLTHELESRPVRSEMEEILKLLGMLSRPRRSTRRVQVMYRYPAEEDEAWEAFANEFIRGLGARNRPETPTGTEEPPTEG